jgi:hypothetical protein
MKRLKTLLLALLTFIALFLVVALFLPSRYEFQRSIHIQAGSDAIYPWINNLKRWPEWTAWNHEKDPTLRYTYDGPEEGAGASCRWTGEKSGNGAMTITESDPASGAKYEIDHGKHRSAGEILFEPDGAGTRVIWTDAGQLGANPLNRYFGLVIDRMIAPDFEAGLARLKQKVEAAAAADGK